MARVSGSASRHAGECGPFPVPCGDQVGKRVKICEIVDDDNQNQTKDVAQWYAQMYFLHDSFLVDITNIKHLLTYVHNNNSFVFFWEYSDYLQVRLKWHSILGESTGPMKECHFIFCEEDDEECREISAFLYAVNPKAKDVYRKLCNANVN